MQFNTFTTAVLAALGLAAQAYGVTYELFTDANCQNKLTDLVIDPVSCATPSPGWSSMKLLGPGDDRTVTVYSVNNCGTPSAGSQQYAADYADCLGNFGFVANAAGLF
ncbi:hypothetical protein MGN70_006948 [Eutypa lata]|uniref:Small secreted protein n=1 Tax=Eutypa lata (strain UCR-EL1) TaxID=1287681 RepID=M7SQI5_EUTLA|nr:hypothetical protein UCREL1_4280 [Eutypa lata UCREL1]KAI1252373.1 hypothetical protein MGN70_006948 [Eutypa lata]